MDRDTASKRSFLLFSKPLRQKIVAVLCEGTFCLGICIRTMGPAARSPMSLEFDPVHPKGRLNLRSVGRPCGTYAFGRRYPALKTLGYFRLSPGQPFGSVRNPIRRGRYAYPTPQCRHGCLSARKYLKAARLYRD